MLFFALALLFSVVFGNIQASNMNGRTAAPSTKTQSAAQTNPTSGDFSVNEDNLDGYIKNRIKEHLDNDKEKAKKAREEYQQEFDNLKKSILTFITNKQNGKHLVYKINDNGTKNYNKDILTQIILSSIVKQITQYDLFTDLNQMGITLDKKTYNEVADNVRAKVIAAIEKKNLKKFLDKEKKKASIKRSLISIIKEK